MGWIMSLPSSKIHIVFGCCCLVSKSCLTLCNPMDCSPPGPSHGGLQARILEWLAIPFSRVSSPPKDRTHISCIAGRHFAVWATEETRRWSHFCQIQGLILNLIAAITLPRNVIQCVIFWSAPVRSSFPSPKWRWGHLPHRSPRVGYPSLKTVLFMMSLYCL